MKHACKLPLLRSWSARSAETREVLVRFQRVALASVAPMQSKRFLPARLLVQVQLEARVGRQSSPRQTTSCPALSTTAACAEVPMPGNNWDPGGATFSRCTVAWRSRSYVHQATVLQINRAGMQKVS
jgi:hypothetical protein